MKQRDGYIDGLKGLAVLAVTLTHTGGYALPGILGTIGDYGARGVQLFFVLSGMLSFRSLDNYFKTRDNLTLGNVVTWYRRKIFRLIPIYYFAIIVSMFTKSWSNYWLGTEGRVSIINFITHIFLVHGFFPHYTNSILGVDWFLGVYVIFLIISPFLYRYIDNLEKSVIFIILIYLINPELKAVVNLIMPIEKDAIVYNAYIYNFGPLTQILIYSLGISIYFIVEKINRCGKQLCQNRILAIVLFLLAIVLLYGQANDAGLIYHMSTDEMFGLWFCILIISQSIHSSVLIDNRFLRLFGKYSFGIYLFQYIWLHFYSRYINYQGKLDWTVKFVVSLIALLVISMVLVHTIEEPLRKQLKKRNVI